MAESTFTVGEAVEAVGYGPYQRRMRLVLGGLWAADASEMLILSFIGPLVMCEWGLTRSEEAAITSVVFLGMLIGATFWGWYCDRFGRRRCFVATTCLCAIAGASTACAPAYWVLLVCRAAVGVGTSGGHVCATLMSEMLPAHKRGEAILGLVVFWAIGAIAVSVAAMVIMPAFDRSTGWRVLVLASSAPLFAVLALSGAIPESPRYNVQRGRPDLALATLRDAARENGTCLPPGRLVGGPVAVSGAQRRSPRLDDDGAAGSGAGSIDRGASAGSDCGSIRAKIEHMLAPPFGSTTVRLLLLWFVSAMTYYGSVLLNVQMLAARTAGTRCSAGSLGSRANSGTENSRTEATHEPSTHVAPIVDDATCELIDDDQYEDALWDSFSELPGILLTILLVDRAGRRRTISGIFFAAAACFALMLRCSEGGEKLWGAAARGLTSGGFQAVYLYTPEVFDTSLRAMVLGVCSSCARFGGALAPFVAQVVFEASNSAAISIFSVLCGAAACAAATLRVETTGKDCDEAAMELVGYGPLDRVGGEANEIVTVDLSEVTGDDSSVLSSPTRGDARRACEEPNLEVPNPFAWSP
jgi:MFS family permease